MSTSLHLSLKVYSEARELDLASGNSPAALDVMTKEYKFRDMNSPCERSLDPGEKDSRISFQAWIFFPPEDRSSIRPIRIL